MAMLWGHFVACHGQSWWTDGTVLSPLPEAYTVPTLTPILPLMSLAQSLTDTLSFGSCFCIYRLLTKIIFTNISFRLCILYI